MSYRITTDSTCDLPRSFYEERQIEYIGLSFRLGEQQYTESKDLPLTSREFYDLLRSGVKVSTMQVNAYEFIQFAEPFLQAGEDILHISFSSGLSGTYSSVVQGAEELKEKYPDRTIVVIDSLCACMGEGLLVYYADQNRKAGMSLSDNANWLMENRLKVCHLFTVNDLMHLHRGGRLSKTSAVLGSMIGIKPILHVNDEGKLAVIGKARGRAAALQGLIDKMKERVDGTIADQTIFISHADCEEDAQKLAEMVKTTFGVTNILIHSIGAVIGGHAGPGTIAVYFMGTKR